MKIGTRIRIDHMEGEPHYNGREGIVEHIENVVLEMYQEAIKNG